jgi:hypothetical protein
MRETWMRAALTAGLLLKGEEGTVDETVAERKMRWQQ